MTHLEIATLALDKIEATRRHHVFASRPGVVAAAKGVVPYFDVTFRRKGGAVRMELWPSCGYESRIDVFDLPPGLQARAARALDDL